MNNQTNGFDAWLRGHKAAAVLIGAIAVLAAAAAVAIPLAARNTEKQSAPVNLTEQTSVQSGSIDEIPFEPEISEPEISEPESSAPEESFASESQAETVSATSEPVSAPKPAAKPPVEKTASAPTKTASKTTSSKAASSKTTSSKTTSSKTAAESYHYNTNADPNDNIFMDSLIYTGYNMKKHRADGNMWVYILASRKRGLGYLSKITYGGGCTGYETSGGKPDIKRFERGGLVCASYVTYVYFNYLPNVAGIDTSMLPRPEDPTLAHSWYLAAKKWVSKGYSQSVPFTAKKNGNYIKFTTKNDFPIGSIIIFRDMKSKADHGSHVSIYAGYVNGYHWVYHVGNANGPEMCAVERMSCGPDPQWPLMVVTTPSNIRMAALLEVTVKDNAGAPVAGASFTLKNAAGKVISLGKTDAKGILRKEGLAYGTYTLKQTVPAGYTCAAVQRSVTLTTKNNSCNKAQFTDTKLPPPPPAEPPAESSQTSDPSEPTGSEQGTPTVSSGSENP